MNSSVDPFKAGNRAEVPAYSHGKRLVTGQKPLPASIAFVPTSSLLPDYSTPNPKKALFDFFAEADSTHNPTPSSEAYPLEKIAQTYKAAYSYNSMQVQKLKSALKSTKTKADSASETLEKATELQETLKKVDYELSEVRKMTITEEEKQIILTTSIATLKSTLETEANFNGNLSKEIAMKQTEKSKLETSLKYTNDRISKLKCLFSDLDSGKSNHKGVILGLEGELRREKLVQKELEEELKDTKEAIQREKQMLVLMQQQYDSISLARKCERDEAKEDLMVVKREEEHWKGELAAKRQALNETIQRSEIVSAAIHRDKAALRSAKQSLSSVQSSSVGYWIAALWVCFFVLGVALKTAAGLPAGVS